MFGIGVKAEGDGERDSEGILGRNCDFTGIYGNIHINFTIF